MNRPARINLATPSLDTVAPKEVRAWAAPRRRLAERPHTTREASSRKPCVIPATFEDDTAAAEREFMEAMRQYKQSSGRMFPTWSEVLEVLQGLGYQKQV